MSYLKATLIDVGWGDSILLETWENPGDEPRFALIDCNDSTKLAPTRLFILRHLQTLRIRPKERYPLFDFVLATHAHADHIQGMKKLVQDFGTDWLWYPKSEPTVGFMQLINYAKRRGVKGVKRHEALHLGKPLPPFGQAEMKCLWPPKSGDDNDPYQPHDEDHPNNNSVVLALKLGNVNFVLTGDCEAENWPKIVGKLPKGPSHLRMFKVPHHGAENGLFHSDGSGEKTPWLSKLGKRTHLALSCHRGRHEHPHHRVVQKLESGGYQRVYRTDQHYHLCFETDGNVLRRQWSDWKPKHP